MLHEICQNMTESQAASQEVLQYLPILFGFFALNVPSGLGIYWVTNTLCSTASMIFIKNQVQFFSNKLLWFDFFFFFLCCCEAQVRGES